jgi:hypothetical protein
MVVLASQVKCSRSLGRPFFSLAPPLRITKRQLREVRGEFALPAIPSLSGKTDDVTLSA